MSQWLVNRLSGVLDSRTTRRSFLRRTALAATAMSVAPVEFVLRPVSAQAVICNCSGSQCDCSSMCCDGYTEFCCTINNGVNACPSSSFVGGWWKADGSIYCAGPRYYIDCMAECTTCSNGCGPGLTFCDPGCDDTFCRCALGSCSNRHAGCTTFRYGQCHQEINCSGRIVCRVASCTPPWTIDSSCSTVTFTDDNTANHNAACLQAPPAPTWSAWSLQAPQPPTGLIGGPAVSSWGPGRLDLFVCGNDHNLYHQWSDGGTGAFGSWENLGAPPGGLTSRPAAVSWGPQRIDVLARGGDHALWHKWFDGVAWYGWESRGGVLISAPAVASRGQGRLDVIAIGRGEAVFHTWFDGQAWWGWESRGGASIMDPGAVSWTANRLDLFVVGTNGGLFHSWFDGVAWYPWTQEVPGTWSSGPAGASWGPDRVDVFVESSATGNPLGHVWFDGRAWYSESQGGGVSAAPAAVGQPVPRLDVFVRGTDALLYHKSCS